MSEKLLQTPTQGIPKSVDEIVGFVTSLKEKGRIKIYAVAPRTLEQGIKLVPASGFGDKQPYVVVSTTGDKHRYHFLKEIKITNDADKDCYGSTKTVVIEKLCSDLHASKILVSHTGKLMFPSGKITVRVGFSYTELWKSAMIDYKVSSVGEMNVEYVPLGLKHIDDFLESVCRFARGEKIN